MDPTLIVAPHVCLFVVVFICMLSFVYGSLGNRKFGVCEGFPFWAGK